MEGTLKIQALRRIFVDMPAEDKVAFLKGILSGLNWKNLKLIGAELEKQRDAIKNTAYEHFSQLDLISDNIMIDFDFACVRYSEDYMNYLSYSRKRGLQTHGHPLTEELIGKFIGVCRDFFDNPKYLWNQ